MTAVASFTGLLRLTLFATAAVILCALPADAQTRRVNPNAKAIAEFEEEVQDYVELHRKLEKTLPDLPDQATPQAIYEHQRALEALIQRHRRGAKPGDIFERDVRPILRKLLYGIFTGPDGARIRDSMMDENPGPTVRLVVNGRYPDTIPLSTVPPQVLGTLPQLPQELEYRFIEDKLILLDRHAHIIVDFLTGAVPR